MTDMELKEAIKERRSVRRFQIDEAGQPFTFRSPMRGILDYIHVYLWDRTENTPESLFTPMDVYLEAVE